MAKFFCMSTDTECIDVAVAVVGTLAKKTKSIQQLYLKEKPLNSEWVYPQVSISTDLPHVLSSQRRAVHENILLDGDEIYFNVWPLHLRGYYCDKINIAGLHKMLSRQAADAGISKRLTKKDILYSGTKPSVLSSISSSMFGGYACFTPRAFNFAKDKSVDIRTLAGSLDIFGFYIPGEKKWNMRNVSWASGNDFLSSMLKSKIVIAERPSEVLWYNNFLRRKTVVCLTPGYASCDIVSCKEILCVDDKPMVYLTSEIKKALS